MTRPALRKAGAPPPPPPIDWEMVIDKSTAPRSPKGPAKYRDLRLTLNQAEYLRELLDDDLAQTDLTADEYNRAEGLLDRLEVLLDSWDRRERG